MHDSGPPYNGRPADEFDATAEEVTCQQFVELVTDYFDGALAERTLSQVEEHLVMCDWCVTYLEQTQFTLDALARQHALRVVAEGVPTEGRIAFHENQLAGGFKSRAKAPEPS